MATVKIDKFGGIAPRQHPTQLADGMAVRAHNVRLETGKLVPLRQPLLATGIGLYKEAGLEKVEDAKSIHVWRKRDGTFEFLLFGGITWISEGNIADDERTRIVISGETGVKYTDDDGKEWNNVPALWMRDPRTGQKIVHVIPKTRLGAPIVTRSSAEPSLDDNRRYTRFFVTWVDEYGLESPVSSPSCVLGEDGRALDEDLEYMEGDSISFKQYEALPANTQIVRIYKVVTGAEEGRIQFIKELPRSAVEGTGAFAVKVKDEDAGEVLKEMESPPPDLRCILDVPGAFYCGISQTYPKTVMFSDINLLYSWPMAYRYDVKDNLVALAVTGNTVFALTDGWPYVLSGTVPESMTVTKLAGPAACVSPRGVCVYRNAVYYVSNAGLMSIYANANEGTVCSNLTDKMFTKEQWQALNPESCVMQQHNGALFLFFRKANNETTGLVINLKEESSIAISTHDEEARCACVDNATDKMYYVREEV